IAPAIFQEKAGGFQIGTFSGFEQARGLQGAWRIGAIAESVVGADILGGGEGVKADQHVIAAVDGDAWVGVVNIAADILDPAQLLDIAIGTQLPPLDGRAGWSKEGSYGWFKNRVGGPERAVAID